MVIRPQFYLADFMTGQMLGPVLHLDNPSFSSSFEPGRFSAQMDMRKNASTFKESKAILSLLREGKCTLVPILEGLSNGSANPAQSRALGEWWISEVDATYSDPVVNIRGPEFAGYFKELLVTATWSGSFSAWVLMRDMMREATRTSQTISFTTGTGAGGPTVDVDIQKSQTDYWAAAQSAQDGGIGNGFEWRVATTLNADGIAPVSVTRTLALQAPEIRYERLGVTLELVTPGQSPASLVDMSRAWSEHSAATTVYGFGAGSGKDQVSAWTSRSRPEGEPGKSRMISVRDAMKYPVLKRATNRALQRATAADQVFPVVMPTDRYTPTIGEVYSWLREPSWSMPESESGTVRCAGWSWSRPSPGAPDNYVLQLVKG